MAPEAATAALHIPSAARLYGRVHQLRIRTTRVILPASAAHTAAAVVVLLRVRARFRGALLRVRRRRSVVGLHVFR